MLLGIFIFIEYHRNDQIFKFEDTKAIVRSHKLKNRQYNSKKRKRQTMVSKGQKEKKTNNGQQRTKREKDKQCSTQKWTENN